MTGMRAARARARAVRSLALSLVRGGGRGGVPAVRSLVRGDAGPGLDARSLPGARGLLFSAPPPGSPRPPARWLHTRASVRGAPVPRAPVPRGALCALGNSCSLPRAPGRPLTPGSRSQHGTGPLPTLPHALPASFPCRPAKPLPISPRPCPESSRGPCFKDSKGCKLAAPGFSPPRPTLCLLWPRGPCRGGSLAEPRGVVSLSPYLSLERN